MDSQVFFQENAYRHINGVPELQRCQIEKISENIVKHFIPDALLTPIPYDIESLMETGFNLTLEYQNLQPDGAILGETIFKQGVRDIYKMEETLKCEQILVKEGTVLIDDSLLENREARLRFTLAHELGHWIFHQSFYGTTEKRACRSYRRQRIYTSHYQVKSPVEWTEWQADTFAAAILIPRPTLRESLRQFLKQNNLSWRKLSDFSDNRSRENYTEFLKTIAQKYGVSKETARIRMNKLCGIHFPN